jgi:hypothetical protein
MLNRKSTLSQTEMQKKEVGSLSPQQMIRRRNVLVSPTFPTKAYTIIRRKRKKKYATKRR